MRKLLLLMIAVIAAFALCACGGSQPTQQSTEANIDQIVGKWELTKMTGENEGEEEDATAMGTVYNFDQDGTMTGIDNGNAITATWKQVDTGSYVVTTDDSNMVFTLDGDILTYQVKGTELFPTMNFIFERK